LNHIVIIGNGIAGITAARYIRKLSDHEITVISKETDHFFSRTALMYIYMGHMKYEHTKPYEDWFWSKNRINLIRDSVEKIEIDNKQLTLQQKGNLKYDKLIIATGSKSNLFGWPGQDLEGVQSLYSIQDLELMEKNTRQIDHAVIVGGGLIGIEMAEMLHSRNIPVTMLIREKSYWNKILPQEESRMISKHIREYNIELQESTELKEILPDGNGKVRSIVTHSGQKIDCQFVGLTVGVHPNIDLVKETKIQTNKGIIVNEYLQTNISDIFAGGDCAEVITPKPGRKNIEAVWYTGSKMGEVLAHNICNHKIEYDPGIWYNSAKFFDIEYQVYGDIKPSPGENENSLYWEHPSGKKSIRINYNNNNTVIGFNLMGIRYRHKVCEKWIEDKRGLDYVLENLQQANFDPEFSRHYENELVSLIS